MLCRRDRRRGGSAVSCADVDFLLAMIVMRNVPFDSFGANIVESVENLFTKRRDDALLIIRWRSDANDPYEISFREIPTPPGPGQRTVRSKQNC